MWTQDTLTFTPWSLSCRLARGRRSSICLSLTPTFYATHISTIPENIISNRTRVLSQSLLHTIQTFKKLKSCDGSLWSNKTSKIVFLDSLHKALNHFPFVGTHSLVTFYTNFRPKLMHLFFLSINQMFTESLIKIIGDQQWANASIKFSWSYLKSHTVGF